jgi:IS5 family transposase
VLSYVGRDLRSQQYIYRSTETQCRSCPEKAKCTSGRVKKIGVSWYEDARRRARSLVQTPEFLRSRRDRSKVEALFSELKQRIGLSRLRLRRIRHASEQFLLAATAQNIKRLVRFLTATPPKPLAAIA